MKAQELVKSLFKDYEETAELRDFMEEIQRNLEDRTESLVKKGFSEKDAFAKAASELGDIGVLADEMSLKRRQEVYQDAYLGIQHYMKPRRVAGYILFGSALAFGIICALIVYFSAGKYTYESLVASSAALLPFFVAAVAGFTFLGLTQETAASYPMNKKRAAWYTLAASLIAFGIVLFPLVYFAVSKDPSFFLHSGPIAILEHGFAAALSSEVPFLIPGIGLLVFLCLTEKSRLKPWAARYAAQLEEIVDVSNRFDAQTIRFGLFSGAIWIFAMGLFIALGFAVGFKYSWLVFVFAVAVQLLVQAMLFKPKGSEIPEGNHASVKLRSAEPKVL